jgi:mannose-6-phosphate isomerase-like protein (cupin superfamily)
MHESKDEIPVRIDTPDATARRQTDFGEASEYGTLGAEHFTLAAGTDITPLLEGLDGDMCQSPHWGYLVDGRLTVTFDDGTEEIDETGDLFYWPPGHTLRADEDSDFVLFSPQREHGEVIDHIERKLSETV